MMEMKTVTIRFPEAVYLRLQQAAQATKQSFDDLLLHVVQIGSPPGWDDVPAEFQADVAALDRLDDKALWRIARLRRSADEMREYQDLLDRQADGTLSEAAALRLSTLRREYDRELLRKAQAAAILQWRGHRIPSQRNILLA